MIQALALAFLAFVQKGTVYPLQEPRTPKILSAEETISLNVPSFGFVGNAICDASGRVFFHPGNGINDLGIFLSASPDGKDHTIYKLPSDTTFSGDTLQAVSPAGSYYLLQQDFKTYRLLHYSNDGTLGRRVLADIPAGVLVQFFAIVDSGVFYVSGYQEATSETTSKTRKGFAALYDDSGKLVRNLSAEAHDVDIAMLASHPQEGDVTAGEDGRFYILLPSEVIVLDQNGEVERRFRFDKPDPNALAMRIDYSGGLISIAFDSVKHLPKHAVEISVRLLLLDAQTGEPRGDYVFDKNLTNTILCFSRKDGYSVFDVSGDKAARQIVPLR